MAVTVEGGRRLPKELRRMARRADNLIVVWPRVGRYLSRTARRQFTTKGAHLGTPWEPLKPEYARRKRLQGYGNRPLVLTGKMRDEFIQRPMKVERYEPQRAEFGSDSNIAVWQHGGTKRQGRKHIPARPILKQTPEVTQELNNVIYDYIVAPVKKRKPRRRSTET